MNKIRTVVIDDEYGIRESLKEYFSRHADTEAVGVAGNGYEAEDLVRQSEPDIVILDLSLPLRGGLETIPIIRRVSPQSKILMITGWNADETVFETVKLGASGFLFKPFETKELMTAICQASNGWLYFDSKATLYILKKLNNTNFIRKKNQLRKDSSTKRLLPSKNC